MAFQIRNGVSFFIYLLNGILSRTVYFEFKNIDKIVVFDAL